MKYGKKLGLMVAVVATVMAMSATVFAQDGAIGGQAESMERNGLGVHAGLMLWDETDPFIGAEGRFTFDLTPEFGLTINPKASYIFVGTGDFEDASRHDLMFDGNVLATLNLDDIRPYGGMGLNIWHWRESFGGESFSETEVNFNILVLGSEFDIDDSMVGFADLQLTRFSFSEGGFSVSFTEPSLRVGINFGI